jgi:hypothetical protein
MKTVLNTRNVFEEVVWFRGLVMDCQGRNRKSMDENVIWMGKPMVTMATPQGGGSQFPRHVQQTHTHTLSIYSLSSVLQPNSHLKYRFKH